MDWLNQKSFSSPSGTDNSHCSDQMSKGYQFSNVPLGPIGKYDAVNLDNLVCKDAPFRGLGKRTGVRIPTYSTLDPSGDGADQTTEQGTLWQGYQGG